MASYAHRTGRADLSELLYAIIEKRVDWLGGEHHTPKSLNSFISKLATVHPSLSVLDPTCGLGLLLDEVATSVGADVVHGIDINSQCCDIAQAVLGTKATILRGDALATTDGLQSTYDLIVANPPFGLKVQGDPSLPYLGHLGDMGHTLALWACDRLSGNGIAMVILTPGFLFN
jgi:type I restriction-modification system DNA methylase subunit